MLVAYTLTSKNKNVLNDPYYHPAAISCYKENIVNNLKKSLLGKMHIWEVVAFSSWGSCHLGKCTLGKLPLEKLHI